MSQMISLRAVSEIKILLSRPRALHFPERSIFLVLAGRSLILDRIAWISTVELRCLVILAHRALSLVQRGMRISEISYSTVEWSSTLWRHFSHELRARLSGNTHFLEWDFRFFQPFLLRVHEDLQIEAKISVYHERKGTMDQMTGISISIFSEALKPVQVLVRDNNAISPWHLTIVWVSMIQITVRQNLPIKYVQIYHLYFLMDEGRGMRVTVVPL